MKKILILTVLFCSNLFAADSSEEKKEVLPKVESQHCLECGFFVDNMAKHLRDYHAKSGGFEGRAAHLAAKERARKKRCKRRHKKAALRAGTRSDD